MATLTRLWHVYGKALTATAIAAFTAIHTALSDGGITRLEAVQIASAIVTAIGVWWFPIHPEWAGMKTAVAALVTVLAAASTVIVNGAGSGSWPQFALAIVTLVLVGAAPAQSTVGSTVAPGKRLAG